MLSREGNAPRCPSAMANISPKAETCEKAVITNALARRDPSPPAKSEAPHKNTAVRLQAAGASWISEDTPEERSMRALPEFAIGVRTFLASNHIVAGLSRAGAPAPH